MELVSFLVGLKKPAKDVVRLPFEVYVQRLIDTYGSTDIYEWLTSQQLGIVYFDVDGKTTDTTFGELMARSKVALRDFFFDVGGYDFDTYVVTATSNGGTKLSIRFYCDKVVATPAEIKKRIELLNLSVNKGGVFDLAVYGTNQKLRAVGSYKTMADKRVLRLLDGVDVHTAIGRTIVQQVPADAKRLQQIPLPPRSHKRKATPSAGAGPSVASPPPVSRVAKSGMRRPSQAEVPALTVLLEDAGFGCPTFLEKPRDNSLTFTALNRGDDVGDCPCCSGEHERQNWMAYKMLDGRYYIKSYSTSCKPLILGQPVTVFAEDPDYPLSASAPVPASASAVETASQPPSSMEVVEVKLDALSTQVHGLTREFRKFVNDVAPAITAEHEADIDPQTIVQSGTAFKFKYMDPAIPDQPFVCRSLVGATAQLQSSRPGAQSTIINLALKWDLLRHLIEDPECDVPYTEWFSFQSGLQGTQWVHDLRRFYSNSGGLWKPVEDAEVKSTFVRLSRASFVPLYETLNAAPDDTIVPQRDHILKGLRACRKHVSTDACAQQFMKAAKTHFLDTTFSTRVDSVLHYLGTQDGVVNLCTGELLPGPASAFVSLSVAATYTGLDTPTPDIDAFFASIFDNDVELVTFMQRWFGYCMTGETKAQKFGIFDGTGSNGKSLMVKLFKALLTAGGYGGSANKFVFFAKSESTNGPTPWLAALHKKRIVFVEESTPQDVVNISQLKDITGGTSIQVRNCHQDPFDMPITHKQMLATNDIPRLDTAEASIKRRLLIVPLKMQYKPANEYDADNPRHRHMNPDLGSKLVTPDAQKQLLAWLVRGAVMWYGNADQTFDAKPAAIRACEAAYISDTDVLQQFLDSHTRTVSGGMIKQSEFNERLRGEHGRVSNLGRKMELKGFPPDSQRIGPEKTTTRVFKGVVWNAT